jgi:hypothetical protein
VGTGRDPCAAGRYLLFSVQRGEGFSLRRDAFVRMSTALRLSSLHEAARGRWTLVLPPLSSRMSPHWHQGLPHAGLGFQERTIPWDSLWDMKYLSEQTGLRFLEYPDFVAEQNRRRAPAPPVLSPGNSDIAIGQVDQVIHLCSFAYNEAFHQASAMAGRDGHPLPYPGSSFPRSHLFREFACMDGETPSRDLGHCGNPLPEILSKKDKPDRFISNEYGELALPRGKKASVHCGLANMQPNIVAPILEEYLSPNVTSDTPVCSAIITNTQLVFWAPAPSRYTAAHDPSRAMHAARQHFLRSWRLAPPLLALAHAFIRHALLASPALELNATEALAILNQPASAEDDAATTIVAAAASLPAYMSFHVRRGDFKVVHKDKIPELDHLALQIVQRFRDEWDRLGALEKNNSAASTDAAAATAAAPLSSRVFVSSDMDAAEFAELERQVALEQVLLASAGASAVDADAAAAFSSSSSLPYPTVTLVRFDLQSVLRRGSALRAHFSPALLAFLDAAAEAAQSAQSRPVTHPAVRHGAAAGVTPAVVPLTPFHVLLLDQLVCELSVRGSHGFVATSTSYVSEMVWQQRRAMGLDDEERWEKETLKPGPKPKQEQQQPQQQQKKHGKDEL